ncbi:granulocyte colony-stimulating factor [Fukomys damarensis]|uniref:granulocyte colony-stimulating factor n=1 Tax=Fukomys damarensis TaxID=885580 RepID=UPI0014556D02|nr:granulocyte colony-stimulating factor [Fukomys damarensis]
MGCSSGSEGRVGGALPRGLSCCPSTPGVPSFFARWTCSLWKNAESPRQRLNSPVSMASPHPPRCVLPSSPARGALPPTVPCPQVHKLLIVVELLLGEIPDRLQFRQPSLKRSLMPYFLLTQAVRTGNLAKFNQVLDQFGEKFQADGTYTLIIRLRHNVIKTALLLLWHGALWPGQEAAPLDPAGPLPLPQSFLLKCLEQARRVQAKALEMQQKLVSECATYKLCHPEELALLGHSLGILWVPLRGCSSQDLQPTRCLHQLQAGLVLYRGLLHALGGISPGLSPTVDTLQLDVTDFATTIWQQMEDLGVAPAVQPTPGAVPTFTSAFQRQVGGALLAWQLQRFLELGYRALRYLGGP